MNNSNLISSPDWEVVGWGHGDGLWDLPVGVWD